MMPPQKLLYHALDETALPPLLIHGVCFEVRGPNYGVSPHRVPEFGLIFLDKGRGWVKQAGHRETVEEGDVFLVFPNVWYSFAAVDVPWEMYWISFSAHGLQPLLRQAGLTPRSFLRRGCDHARLKEMFENALRRAGRNEPGGLIGIPLLTYALLDEITSVSPPEQPALPAGVLAARRAIDENPQAHLSIEHLAQVAGLSQFHFMRAFKKEFGRSPVQYQISRRMAAAKRLLAGGATVTKTAQQVGYSDIFYFSRVFKLKTGIAPTEYSHRHLLRHKAIK